jgi:flagellar protein FliS
VVILYEELLRSSTLPRSALVVGKADAFRSGRERSISILIALEASLDLDQGGDVAALLGGIYGSMRRELSSFGAGNSPEKLEALRSGSPSSSTPGPGSERARLRSVSIRPRFELGTELPER